MFQNKFKYRFTGVCGAVVFQFNLSDAAASSSSLTVYRNHF